MKRRLLTVVLTLYALVTILLVWPKNLQPEIFQGSLDEFKKVGRFLGIRSGMKLFGGFKGHQARRHQCLIVVSRALGEQNWKTVRTSYDKCALPDFFILRSDYEYFLLRLFESEDVRRNRAKQRLLEAYCLSRGEVKLTGNEILFAGLFKSVRNYQNGAVHDEFDWSKGYDCGKKELVTELPAINELPNWVQQKLRLQGTEI